MSEEMHMFIPMRYNVSHHYTGPHKSVQFLCNSEIFLNAGKKKRQESLLN